MFAEIDRSALRHVYLESRRGAFHWVDPLTFADDDFDRDTEGESIWVAANGNAPVGFVSAWTPENFIHNLFVHPNAVGHGIGSALLKECLANIGRPAVLKCTARNVRARDFYLDKGWQIVSDGIGPDGKYLVMHFA